MTFLNKSAYQCSVFVRQICLDMQHFTTLSEARDPLSFSDSSVCELFLSFLPICLPALNRLKNTHICTHAHPDMFDAFCCLQPQITSRVEESGGSVWRERNGIALQMIQSKWVYLRDRQPQTIQDQTRSHSEREGEIGWRKKGGENANEEGETDVK